MVVKITLHITGPPPIGLNSKKDGDGGSACMWLLSDGHASASTVSAMRANLHGGRLHRASVSSVRDAGAWSDIGYANRFLGLSRSSGWSCRVGAHRQRSRWSTVNSYVCRMREVFIRITIGFTGPDAKPLRNERCKRTTNQLQRVRCKPLFYRFGWICCVTRWERDQSSERQITATATDSVLLWGLHTGCSSWQWPMPVWPKPEA